MFFVFKTTEGSFNFYKITYEDLMTVIKKKRKYTLDQA